MILKDLFPKLQLKLPYLKCFCWAILMYFNLKLLCWVLKVQPHIYTKCKWKHWDKIKTWIEYNFGSEKEANYHFVLSLLPPKHGCLLLGCGCLRSSSSRKLGWVKYIGKNREPPNTQTTCQSGFSNDTHFYITKESVTVLVL